MVLVSALPSRFTSVPEMEKYTARFIEEVPAL
jgi:hypothetical protein